MKCNNDKIIMSQIEFFFIVFIAVTLGIMCGKTVSDVKMTRKFPELMLPTKSEVILDGKLSDKEIKEGLYENDSAEKDSGVCDVDSI